MHEKRVSTTIKVPKGLYGVIVTQTQIAKSSVDGSLVYRGYSINELAEKASFEEVAFLIMKGHLPKKSELDEFSKALQQNREIPEPVLQLVNHLPQDSHPMDVLRTAVSSLGTLESTLSNEQKQLSIASKMPSLATLSYPHTRSNVKKADYSNYSSFFLEMLSSRKPDSFESWIFERVLMLYLEHDLNASSFTVRVVASTQADVYAAITAGVCALKGPLHGGANEDVAKVLNSLPTAEAARTFVRETLAKGLKVPGFGHRIYKKVDPRAQICKTLLKRLLNHKGLTEELYEKCVAMEEEMWNQKRLPANLDFYAAPIFMVLNIPIPLYTPIFAASRVFGWIAHYNEQLLDNKIIRPDAEYVGPQNLKYTPIEKR
jgi:citrate synthase